jgi:hypothetical protein
MTKKNNRKDAERWNQDRDSLQSNTIVTITRRGFGLSIMPMYSGRSKYYEQRDMWVGRYVFGNEF